VSAVPELVAAVDTGELWKLGDSTFVLPVIEDGMPDGVAIALNIHRGALIHGKCGACGKRRWISRTGSVVVSHPKSCLGNKELIGEWLDLWTLEVERARHATRKSRLSLLAHLDAARGLLFDDPTIGGLQPATAQAVLNCLDPVYRYIAQVMMAMSATDLEASS
jgi:hypothetical protein